MIEEVTLEDLIIHRSMGTLEQFFMHKFNEIIGAVNEIIRELNEISKEISEVL